MHNLQTKARVTSQAQSREWLMAVTWRSRASWRHHSIARAEAAEASSVRLRSFIDASGSFCSSARATNLSGEWLLARKKSTQIYLNFFEPLCPSQAHYDSIFCFKVIKEKKTKYLSTTENIFWWDKLFKIVIIYRKYIFKFYVYYLHIFCAQW